jgi:hypothetical protein
MPRFIHFILLQSIFMSMFVFVAYLSYIVAPHPVELAQHPVQLRTSTGHTTRKTPPVTLILPDLADRTRKSSITRLTHVLKFAGLPNLAIVMAAEDTAHTRTLHTAFHEASAARDEKRELIVAIAKHHGAGASLLPAAEAERWQMLLDAAPAGSAYVLSPHCTISQQFHSSDDLNLHSAGLLHVTIPSNHTVSTETVSSVRHAVLWPNAMTASLVSKRCVGPLFT